MNPNDPDNPNGYWNDADLEPPPDILGPTDGDDTPSVATPSIDTGSGGRSMGDRIDSTKNAIDKVKGSQSKHAAKRTAESGAKKAAAGGAEAAGAAAKGAATGGRVAAGAATGPAGWAVLAASLAADPKVQKTLQKAVIVIILVILAGAALLLGGGTIQHINTKEVSTESTARVGFHTIQVRYGTLKAETLFTDPENCGEPVYCKLSPGVSQKEIDKLREQGIEVDVLTSGAPLSANSDNKKFLKQLTYRNIVGVEPKTVTKADFAEKYRTDSNLYEKMERITSAGSIYYRSPRAVERFSLYGATRTNPYSEEETDVEKLVEPFREVVFGQVGSVQSLGYGLNEPIEERAREIQSTVIKDGVPSTIIANTAGFDTANNNSEIQKQIDEDATKKAVQSIFNGLGSKEQVCSFAFGLDALNFNTKRTKAMALARYGGHFMTMADANKLQAVVTSQHVSLINGIQAAKSETYDSKGLIFDQSEGYLLSSQGKIESKRGIGGFARSASGGNPSLLYLNQIVGNLNTVTPINDAASKPLYTTEDLKAAYNSADPCQTLYDRTGNPSDDQRAKMSLLMGQYMAPQFVLNKAGTINPDPRTDPEKGYGSGNAVAAGLGALTSGIGRNLGMEALRQNEMESTIEKSNTTSFLPGYNVDKPGYIDNYRNKLCNDRTISGAGIATDMFCNIQWGYTEKVLLDPKYSPRSIISTLRTSTDWRIGSPCYRDNVINSNPRISGPDGYNDPGVESSKACIDSGDTPIEHISESGAINTQRFQDYMTHCIQSDKAIIDEANWGEKQFGAESAAYCALDQNEIFRYFRLFIFDSNILEADQMSIDDTLGKSASAAAAIAVENQGMPSSGDEASLQAKVKEFAWEDGRRGGLQKPAYTAAVNRSAYRGGKNGNDCGAFVHILMRESGFEPNYPASNSSGQAAWMSQNWNKLGGPGQVDVSQLRPGDVAHKPGHVFVWIGQVEGFVSMSAEAALGSNTAPTAIKSSNTYSDPTKYTWYRKP